MDGVRATDLQEYAEKKLKIRDLQKEVSKLQGECDATEATLVDWMVDNGFTNIKTVAGTVYMHSQVWVSAPDMEDPLTGEPSGKNYEVANECLRAHGYGHFIRELFNVHEVSALVRELIRNDELPETLSEGLKITEKTTLRVRKR